MGYIDVGAEATAGAAHRGLGGQLRSPVSSDSSHAGGRLSPGGVGCAGQPRRMVMTPGQPGKRRRPPVDADARPLTAVKPAEQCSAKARLTQLVPFVLLGIAVAAATILTSEHCEDQSQSCADWAIQGECTKNPSFMLQACGASCGHCRHSSRRMHRRLDMVSEYGVGPLYLAMALLSCAVARQNEAPQEALPLYVVQVIGIGAMLPWTAFGCAIFYCHGLLTGSNLGFAAGGFSSGVCGFVGALAAAAEFRDAQHPGAAAAGLVND